MKTGHVVFLDFLDRVTRARNASAGVAARARQTEWFVAFLDRVRVRVRALWE